ncbi:MAG: tRNA (adenosine(37)-N6)-threonylcarbamoyltransferase complex dimerization subunit type 1 TsaB [Ruminococcaceae bacterium]|nr:tRNA (adenosine(37)-N6)-threonylcarbamoyltransferase complex dimerization subunit type 1 TsaB [Oscillospiraceae bacterium]
MKILAIDSSAVSCSVALSNDSEIIALEFVNNGLTHSQTLLPMVECVCQKAQVSLQDIDLFAVTNGPGSFTGVRIGVAALKGLAFPADKPCIGISTLEVIAANIEKEDCIAIACMDARRAQVYTATFESVTLRRLTPDEAVAAESLAERIQSYDKPVWLAGDGATLAYEILKDKCDNILLAAEENRYQNAAKLCELAYNQRDKAVQGAALVPTYLRMSQAQRELKKKGIKR